MKSPFGNQLKSSPKVNQIISELVAEVSSINQNILGIQKPIEELKENYQTVMKKLGTLRGRPLHYPYVGSGSGRGPFVELEDGSIKLDLINGIGIHILGHSHPEMLKAAVRGALSDIIMQGNLQPNIEYQQLAEKLIAISSKRSRLKHVWFATCGTMANENALKMARQKKTPARMIITFKNAFAGRSTLMAEVTDNPSFKVGLPEYNEVLRVPYFDKKDPQSIEKTLRMFKEHYSKHENNVSTFVFEPILGEGGFHNAPREFFIPILEFCKEKKIPVWADEVQTFARTGEFFAFETIGIGDYIDICTVAKTIQLGATFYTEEYNPQPGLISGTFSGNSSSMVAAMTMLDLLQKGYMGADGRINKIHQRFATGLNKLGETSCKGKISDVSGLGLMVAFTPYDGKKEVVDNFLKRLFENGVIAFNCGKDPIRIRFLVPAIIEDKEIDLALGIVEKTLLES